MSARHLCRLRSVLVAAVVAVLVLAADVGGGPIAFTFADGGHPTEIYLDDPTTQNVHLEVETIGAGGAMRATQKLVDPYDARGSWKALGALSGTQREKLDAALKALVEDLAPVAALCDLRAMIEACQ